MDRETRLTLSVSLPFTKNKHCIEGAFTWVLLCEEVLRAKTMSELGPKCGS